MSPKRLTYTMSHILLKLIAVFPMLMLTSPYHNIHIKKTVI